MAIRKFKVFLDFFIVSTMFKKKKIIQRITWKLQEFQETFNIGTFFIKTNPIREAGPEGYFFIPLGKLTQTSKLHFTNTSEKMAKGRPKKLSKIKVKIESAFKEFVNRLLMVCSKNAIKMSPSLCKLGWKMRIPNITIRSMARLGKIIIDFRNWSHSHFFSIIRERNLPSDKPKSKTKVKPRKNQTWAQSNLFLKKSLKINTSYICFYTCHFIFGAEMKRHWFKSILFLLKIRRCRFNTEDSLQLFERNLNAILNATSTFWT